MGESALSPRGSPRLARTRAALRLTLLSCSAAGSTQGAMIFSAALACLVLSAAAVPDPPLYACRGGQCVPDPRGLPLSQCEAACEPNDNYICAGGPSGAKSAPRSLRRALLTPQANTGPCYHRGRST